tara:strand:- start:512 stop:649 length:138 start_codon:yes stop_codon:yes gene_type:complete
MSFVVEVIANCGMYGDKFLRGVLSAQSVALPLCHAFIPEDIWYTK